MDLPNKEMNAYEFVKYLKEREENSKEAQPSGRKIKIKLNGQRVCSEGNAVELDDGTPLGMVQSVKIEASVGEPYSRATIEILATEAEVEILQRNTEVRVTVLKEDGSIPEALTTKAEIKKVIEEKVNEIIVNQIRNGGLLRKEIRTI